LCAQHFRVRTRARWGDAPLRPGVEQARAEVPSGRQFSRQLGEAFGTSAACRHGVAEQSRHVHEMLALGDQGGRSPNVAVPGDLVQGLVELGAGFYAGQEGGPGVIMAAGSSTQPVRKKTVDGT
jgi:hypothetical protein